MYLDGKIQLATDSEGLPAFLLPSMANRHGLIAGATGTGKTVTLKALAQSFSDAGVPSFLVDVKGDVSGMAVAGEASEKLTARLAALGVSDYDFHAAPTRFWDVYGEEGVPVRTTITEMGPTLMARLLGLSEVQEGVLNIAFHVADDEGWLLLDLKDLRSMLAYLGEHADEFTSTYGNVAKQSVGAIQRALLQLEDAGGELFFGEPALRIEDWMACDASGRGYVNVLDCVKLVQSPLLYSTFLLWMLSELYESLPEAGDLDRPKIVFFFDEAHLLFDDAPKALLDKVEQVVKLIRSKGVGVWFITQSPADIPDAVLAQLGNRVQHALRAYTPAERKAVKTAAESFRENPAFDTVTAISELGTGEALVSFLDEEGRPGVVQRTKVIAPACSMGAAPSEAKRAAIEGDALLPKYAQPLDRESAYEILDAKAAAAAQDAEREAAAAELARRQAAEMKEQERARAQAEKELAAAQKKADAELARQVRESEKRAAAEEREREKAERQRRRDLERVANAALTSMSRSLGGSFARGLLSVLKKR